MMKSVALSALMLVASSAVAAQEATPAPTPPAQAEAAEKKICRTERMTGSLTRSTRTCMTKAEWARLAENTRKSVNNIINDAGKGEGQAAGMGTSSGPGL